MFFWIYLNLPAIRGMFEGNEESYDPEEIEEFLVNPTRAILSFFSNRWLEFHLGLNPYAKSIRDKKL